MKRLVAPGVVIIVPSSATARRASPGVTPKSFAPRYPDVFFYSSDMVNWFVGFHAVLADGLMHTYYYSVGESYWPTHDLVVRCSTSFDPAYPQFFGGKCFNPEVRPFLVSKDVPP